MGARFAGSWLLGIGGGLMTMAILRGDYGELAFPFLLGATGFLVLTHRRQPSNLFPSTDLEHRLDRLFALVLPARRGMPPATARAAISHQRQLAGLRRGARRWGTQLQLITIDGYETASRISALRVRGVGQDDTALPADALRSLSAERASAGADLGLAPDPVSMLAYGLGARPAAADLTSLEDLLRDLGLATGGDELRTHFDDVVAAESTAVALQLKTHAERTMFRDLAGASFVLGASARILELVSLPPLREAPNRVVVPS